jgi:hypothetical protein
LNVPAPPLQSLLSRSARDKSTPRAGHPIGTALLNTMADRDLPLLLASEAVLPVGPYPDPLGMTSHPAGHGAADPTQGRVRPRGEPGVTVLLQQADSANRDKLAHGRRPSAGRVSPAP